MTKRTAAEILGSPEALALGRKRDKLVSIRNEQLSKDDERWANEINVLSNRVKNAIEEVELGDGDKIAIWARLSEAETKVLSRLQKMQMEVARQGPVEELDEESTEALNVIQYQILELVTVNPLITAQWLQENPEQFATQDLVAVSLGYYLKASTRAQGAAEAKSFRRKSERTELGRDAESPRVDVG
jgi:hypothetical protein